MTETDLPRTGAHDVDWPALERGSPVRQLLNDLTGSDPAARTTALRDLARIAPDGVDVRPWVAEALPALLALVADAEQPDRGRILRLVGDLTGADRTWYMAGETLRAKRRLADFAGLTDLLADEDHEVRDAAAYTVRAVARLTPGLAEMLWERYVEEPDPAVRVTLLCSGVIIGAVGSGHEPTRTWLAWVADTDGDLRVRATALTELMALPDPPPFDAETARDTLVSAYREGLHREPAPLPAGWRVGARGAVPGYHQVVSAVRATFRNDVGAHLDLLAGMLALDSPDAWRDGLYEARSLVQRLRGPYLPLVRRAAELLLGPEPWVRGEALRLLQSIGEVGRPGADAVWVALSGADLRVRPYAAQDGDVVWVDWRAQGPVLGPAVQMLAELRDERILPKLERLLDEAPEAGDLHRRIAGYGVRARGLSRTLRRRLRGLRPDDFADPWRYDAQRKGLLEALTAVAPNEAAEHLAQEPADVATLGLLARAGRSAAARIPDIRTALTSGDPAVELAAAQAIWQVAGDAEAAAAVYDRYFDDRNTPAEYAVAAIDGLGQLGIRVSGRARRLTRRMTGRSGGDVVVAAADALWRVAGSREAARTLGRAWESMPLLRPRIARAWVDSGNARYGARYAQAELDTVVRHNVNSYGLPPGEISEDERLLELCRELVTTGPGGR
ncbi:hypothetical protein [Actinoplanes sp. GCM10030250]|uniref:hypothetical protein n=1 Tax=Actinoplanes sp. GCM10030250 TaxID=3273376 RepID=UPI00360ED272